MSNSVRPHRMQPTMLPRPWDSSGKKTGVGCHFLLQCRKAKSETEVAQPCPTLWDPMDCILPGSSIHGIFQARVLEWVAIALYELYVSIQFSSVQLLSHVWLFATPWIAANQACVSITNSQNSFKLMKNNDDINSFKWEYSLEVQKVAYRNTLLSFKEYALLKSYISHWHLSFLPVQWWSYTVSYKFVKIQWICLPKAPSKSTGTL